PADSRHRREGRHPTRPRGVDPRGDVRRHRADSARPGADLTGSRPSQAITRETQAYPVVQRTSIRFFRRVTRYWINVFRDVGQRTYFLRDIARGFGDPATYVPETVRQMKNIGVDSVPLTVIVAAFIGGVIALQTRYQLLAGVELSIIGLASRLMILLELGPLLTGLVLAGRVVWSITGEVGPMR